MILRSLKIIGGALVYLFALLVMFAYAIVFADFEPTDAPACTRVQVVSFLDSCRGLP